MKKIAFATLLFLSVAVSAFAHSGGTDSMGCHTDHSTGLWHCHGGR